MNAQHYTLSTFFILLCASSAGCFAMDNDEQIAWQEEIRALRADGVRLQAHLEEQTAQDRRREDNLIQQTRISEPYLQRLAAQLQETEEFQRRRAERQREEASLYNQPGLTSYMPRAQTVMKLSIVAAACWGCYTLITSLCNKPVQEQTAQ